MSLSSGILERIKADSDNFDVILTNNQRLISVELRNNFRYIYHIFNKDELQDIAYTYCTRMRALGIVCLPKIMFVYDVNTYTDISLEECIDKYITALKETATKASINLGVVVGQVDMQALEDNIYKNIAVYIINGNELVDVELSEIKKRVDNLRINNSLTCRQGGNINHIRNLSGRNINLIVGDTIVHLETEIHNLPNVHYKSVEDTGVKMYFNGNKLPVSLQEFTEITDLPEPRRGVILIVRPIVARAAAHRPDVFTVTDPIVVNKRKRTQYRSLLHY